MINPGVALVFLLGISVGHGGQREARERRLKVLLGEDDGSEGEEVCEDCCLRQQGYPPPGALQQQQLQLAGRAPQGFAVDHEGRPVYPQDGQYYRQISMRSMPPGVPGLGQQQGQHGQHPGLQGQQPCQQGPGQQGQQPGLQEPNGRLPGPQEQLSRQLRLQSQPDYYQGRSDIQGDFGQAKYPQMPYQPRMTPSKLTADSLNAQSSKLLSDMMQLRSPSNPRNRKLEDQPQCPRTSHNPTFGNMNIASESKNTPSFTTPNITPTTQTQPNTPPYGKNNAPYGNFNMQCHKNNAPYGNFNTQYGQSYSSSYDTQKPGYSNSEQYSSPKSGYTKVHSLVPYGAPTSGFGSIGDRSSKTPTKCQPEPSTTTTPKPFCNSFFSDFMPKYVETVPPHSSPLSPSYQPPPQPASSEPESPLSDACPGNRPSASSVCSGNCPYASGDCPRNNPSAPGGVCPARNYFPYNNRGHESQCPSPRYRS